MLINLGNTIDLTRQGFMKGKKKQVTGKSRLRNTHRKDNAEAGQYLLLKED